MLTLILILFLIRFGACNDVQQSYRSPWHYKCQAGLCKKELITEEVTAPLSLEVCELFCGASSSLWPTPTGHLSLSRSTVQLDPAKISLNESVQMDTRLGHLLWKNLLLLRSNAKHTAEKAAEDGNGVGMIIEFVGIDEAENIKLILNTDESYNLFVTQISEELLRVTISAKTYFGARHAMETLGQLIVFDDLRNQIRIPNEVSIKDGPAYRYRGVLLDTSRNFVDKTTILRTIDGMAASKLNTLHWHIVDSQSFPYVSRTWPEFSRYGSYTPDRVYKQEDVREIVEYGITRGVRVLPEFDAPAHVGEGWQWVENDALACFKAEPWKNYCVEPPCGQLNPISEIVYTILAGIYKDMVDDFHPDLFHMGGDEVNINCWNSSSLVTDWMQNIKGWNLSESSFYKLWNVFQERAFNELTLANGGETLPVILWTSGLTNDENIKYLNSSHYIIQIWTDKSDSTIGRLLRNNFKIILSNYDALYLDCGFAAWVGEGNNWCSPYKGWQTVYDNSPLKIIRAQRLRNKLHLVLGGEVALWTEQADSESLDSKIWPRAAALAERLWTEPNSTWIHAEQRMLRHRERLVKRGISAESLQPLWCLQNQGHCYA